MLGEGRKVRLRRSQERETAEPRGPELVARYQAVYGIPADAAVTEQMILRHWELERRLTAELRESRPDNRWEIFERCYSTLYSELEWLNRLGALDQQLSPEYLYEDWVHMIGKPPKRVYEVGSGKGELIGYLARLAFECRGSEVTRERGERWASPHPNLSWGITDGVHLEKFEPADTYDVVISDQLIEHLHPHDLVEHFRGALRILAPGGRYIFATPHAFFGPMDVSQVFGCETPKGMHLKEYTYAEIVRALREAGFTRIYGSFKLPRKVRRLLGGRPHPRLSRLYLRYLRLLESLIGALPTQHLKRRVARASKLLLFDGVVAVAQKA